MMTFSRVLGFAAGFMMSAGAVQSQSLYGCEDLPNFDALPAIEGTSGVFYRIIPDMQNFHPFSEETAELLAEFSEALAEKGTTLIFAPVPTKSLAMPGYLNSVARDFGFDLELASTNYDLALRELEDVGVTYVNVRAGLRAAGPSELVMYRADYRLTALGARLFANAVNEVIQNAESGTARGSQGFTISQTGTRELDSPMRNQLQQRCRDKLPTEMGGVYEVRQTQNSVASIGGSLLVDEAAPGRIALVGTEYSAEPTSNLSGFLAEITGMEVLQYAVPGGGAYSAISAYITSAAFRRSPPTYLIWEVPVYYNLAQFSDQPIRELISAVSEDCRVAIQMHETNSPSRMSASLSAFPISEFESIHLDVPDSGVQWVNFHFSDTENNHITRSIYRNPDQIATGQFFLTLRGLPNTGGWNLEIEFDRPVTGTARLSGCYS